MSLVSLLDSSTPPSAAFPTTSTAPDSGPGSEPLHGALGHLSSDEELQQAVCAALLRVPGLDASGIQVAVLAHGEITLLGKVATPHERNLALHAAREHAGGRSLHADLAIAPRACRPPP